MLNQAKLKASYEAQFKRAGVDPKTAKLAADLVASGRINLSPEEQAVVNSAWAQLRLS